jgi:Flp pilus assembly protein TadB
MTTQRPWVWIGGVLVVAAVALALGTPLETLSVIALILICPLAMYFMMSGMGRRQEPDHAGMDRKPDILDLRRTPTGEERQPPHH